MPFVSTFGLEVVVSGGGNGMPCARMHSVYLKSASSLTMASPALPLDAVTVLSVVVLVASAAEEAGFREALLLVEPPQPAKQSAVALARSAIEV
jgi:hypothetical protein